MKGIVRQLETNQKQETITTQVWSSKVGRMLRGKSVPEPFSQRDSAPCKNGVTWQEGKCWCLSAPIHQSSASGSHPLVTTKNRRSKSSGWLSPQGQPITKIRRAEKGSGGRVMVVANGISNIWNKITVCLLPV